MWLPRLGLDGYDLAALAGAISLAIGAFVLATWLGFAVVGSLLLAAGVIGSRFSDR
jgi:hypothetical protein